MRMRGGLGAALALALLCGEVAPAQQVNFRRIEIPPGGETLRHTDRVQGRLIEDRIFQAEAGQKLTLRLEVVHPSFRMELLPPEGDALWVGDRLNDRWSGELPAKGHYTLRATLRGSAARTGQRVGFVLGVALE